MLDSPAFWRSGRWNASSGFVAPLRAAAFRGQDLRIEEVNDPLGKKKRPLRGSSGTVLPITHPGRDDFLSLIIGEESFYVPLS